MGILGATKQMSQIDLSTTMVYIQDVERDAGSSTSTHRMECECESLVMI